MCRCGRDGEGATRWSIYTRACLRGLKRPGRVGWGAGFVGRVPSVGRWLARGQPSASHLPDRGATNPTASVPDRGYSDRGDRAAARSVHRGPVRRISQSTVPSCRRTSSRSSPSAARRRHTRARARRRPADSFFSEVFVPFRGGFDGIVAETTPGPWSTNMQDRLTTTYLMQEGPINEVITHTYCDFALHSISSDWLRPTLLLPRAYWSVYVFHVTNNEASKKKIVLTEPNL